MKLDSGTIIQLYLICSLTFYVLIRLSFGEARTPCVNLWLNSLMSYAVSCAFFILRFIGPLSVSVIGGNIAFSLAMSLSYASLRRIGGQDADKTAFWLPVLLIGVLTVILVDDPVLRLPMVNGLLGLQAVLLIRTALRLSGDFRRITRTIMAVGFVMAGLACAMRLTATLKGHSGLLDFFANNTVQSVTMTMILLCLILTSFCFVLMHRERAEAEARNQAMLDHLTGIPNRRSFDLILDKELHRLERDAGHLSLLVADLDRFKDVNDRFGHEVGDRVLADFAIVLAAQVRVHDYVFRYGGEEFCVILGGADRPAALAIAERIRSEVETRQVLSHGNEIRYTVSIGVATSAARSIPSREEFFRQADAALLQAKRTGRNRVTHCDDIGCAQAADSTD